MAHWALTNRPMPKTCPVCGQQLVGAATEMVANQVTYYPCQHTEVLDEQAVLPPGQSPVPGPPRDQPGRPHPRNTSGGIRGRYPGPSAGPARRRPTEE